MHKISLMTLFALALLLMSGCGTMIRRSDYKLERYDHLVVSDSPVLALQPKKLSRGKLEIEHSILLKNISKNEPVTVHPEKSTFIVNDEVNPAACKIHNGSGGEVVIISGKQARIDCTVVLTANSKNRLAVRDATGTLEVPYGRAGKKLKFNYFLNLEDFE